MREGDKFNEINEKIASIIIERPLVEPDKLNMVRARISQWSNNIPFHDLTDLGNKIEVLSVVETPSYIITLVTLYEKRELKKGEKPYRGGPIPPKLLNEENINIWSFQTPLPEDFEEKKESFVISTSQEVFECSTCNGKGEVFCSACGGMGWKTCAYCGGKGDVKCKNCDGRGEEECGRCGGSGQIEEGKDILDRPILKNCSKCGGRGWIPCKYCVNGYQRCAACGGKGEIRCEVCRGKGMVICKRCEGRGRVVKYLYFDDIFTPITNVKIINHLDLPEEIISGKSAHIYYIKKEPLKEAIKGDKKKSEIIDDFLVKKAIEEQEGDIIFEITQERIPENILETSTHIDVKRAVSHLISSSKEIREMGFIDKNYKIVKQKLTIKQINVLRVNYKYLDKTYSLWLYGKENELLFAPLSPISEVSDSYYVSAQELFKEKKYLQALDFIEKVILMNPKREDAQKLRKTIKRRIALQYIIGSVVGSGLIGLSGGIVGVLACGVIVGLPVGWLCFKIFSTKIRNSILRYLFSFIASIVLTIIISILCNL